MNDKPIPCSVCGEKAAGFAASPIGAWVNAYCPECAHEKAEPWADVVAAVAVNGSLRQCSPMVHRMLEGTLLRLDRSRKQFDQAVSDAKARL